MDINYWNGLYCLDYKLADFTKKEKDEVVTLISQVALKLFDGQLAGRLEKLQGCGSYSVRVNGKGRMKFTTTKVNDVPYLLFLEYLPNHEYHRSKFNDPQSIQRAKELFCPGEDSITRNILEGIDNTTQEKPVLEEITHYRGQDIILTKKQADILEEKLPMVVLGQPGSGKTCIASQLILNYVTSRPNTQNHVLYLTNTKHLAEEMKENYEKSPVKTHSLCQVSFIDYESFLRMHFGNEIEDSNFATRDEFDNWMRSQKTNISAENLYQEFPLIFFNETLEKYRKLGKKQCLIQDPIQKEEAMNLLSDYLKYLRSKKLIDKRLFTPQGKLPKYDFVVIDEAQGFAQTQVDVLSRLSVDNQHAFLLDTKQNQYSSLPVRQQTVEILQRPFREPINQFELEENFRNSPAVLKVANALLTLGNIAIGGELDEKAYTEMHSAPTKEADGCAEWVDYDEVESKLKQCEGSREWAIICHKELKAEVKKRLNTPLIFSFDEVQGLQYPKVIVWGLPNPKLFREINNVLPDTIKSSSTKKHNPKDQDRSKFAPVINAYHVALTRAERELYIVGRASDERYSKVSKCLKSSMSNTKQTVDEPVKTSVLDWKEEADKLERMGLQEQAKAIRDQFKESAVVDKQEKKESKKSKKKSKKKNASKGPVKENKEIPTYDDLLKKANGTFQTYEKLGLTLQKIQGFEKLGNHLENESKKVRDQIKGVLGENEEKKVSKSPFEDYVDGAAKNISGNIVTILKHSTCDKILYETKLSNGKTLYDVIKENPIVICRNGFLDHVLRLPKGRELLKKIKKENTNPNFFKMPFEPEIISDSIDRNDVEYLIGLHEIFMDLRDIVIVDTRGLTVTHYAAYSNKSEILEALHNLGFNLNAPISDGPWKGITPAGIAVKYGLCKVLVTLSKLGVGLEPLINDNLEEYEYATLASIAAANDQCEILKTLSHLDIDINAPLPQGSKKGMTPAAIAAQIGHSGALFTLSKLGVDLTAPMLDGEFKGMSPADIAAAKGHINVLEALKLMGIAPSANGLTSGKTQ